MSQGLTRELMAMRAARELQEGMYINLGMGLPSLVSDFIPREKEVILQTENGILGVGRILPEEEWDPDLVNASANPVSLIPGAAIFNSADSFGMIRGGHLDISILGAFQVSEKGDLANWRTEAQRVGGVGGAMDLAVGVKRVIALMEHTTKSGAPRILKECTLPLTAKGVVKTIITNLAVIEVTPGGLVLAEIAPGISLGEVQAVTQPRLIVSQDLKPIEL